MAKQKTIWLEVTGLDDSKREFEWDHAQRIMDIQEKKGRHDWVLSGGQKLTVDNGSIRPVTDPGTHKKGKEAGRS
jgi:hypothetical protein